MSILDQFKEQFAELPDQLPLVPEGNFNAVFSGYQEDHDNCILRLRFTLQNNPGICFPGTQAPVDGSQVEMTLWLPKPEDWSQPANFGARYDSEGHRRLAQVKRALKNLGIEDFSQDLATAIQAALNTPVIVTVKHRQVDDATYEQVSKIMSV